MKRHFVNFAGEMGMDLKNGILQDVFKGRDPGIGSLHFPFSVSWTSPSNIALVKYWGKKAGQLPANPSLSVTLQKAVTHTSLKVLPITESKVFLSVNGSPDHPFVPKLSKLLDYMSLEVPVLKKFSFDVQTSNTFPHSVGIASSASGISAFSLCMLTFLSRMRELDIPESDFLRLASFISRIGSGSACRSVYGGFSLWGRTPELAGTSDYYAVPVTANIHPVVSDLRDAILVVSSKPKSLASSAGHGLMESHPFAVPRYRQAVTNLRDIIESLGSGDIDKLAIVTENEALTLHALIMSSQGGTILLEPGSLSVINKIRSARAKGIPVFFTIDAGPNIHVLYPSGSAVASEKFIREELAGLCEDGLVIFDQCGSGPVMKPGNRQ